MINKILVTLILVLATNFSIAGGVSDLALININQIGPELLNEIKNNNQIEWWVEMGDKMVISGNLNEKSSLPSHLSIIATKKNINTINLAFQSLGHCNHTDENEKIHETVDVLFSNASFQIINIENISNKAQLYSHDLVKPFSKNKVLSYQYRNRKHDKSYKAAEQMQILVDKVDKDRWFSQVEYLANLDRMENDDLVIAGEWLEDKFSNLGLMTSRIALHDHRGFNILGFKLGTTKPDDWYVVGAHIDSRNITWDDALPSPGAEDNASGCSGVLEIANVISQYETESSIIFMCFTAEEYGSWGSGDVIIQMTEDGNFDKVKSMLNMDMISYRLGNRNVAIAGTDNIDFESLALKVASFGNIYTDIDWQISTNSCCTDFERFSEKGVPAVTSNQPDIATYFGYHQTTDLPENLDKDLGSGIVKANLATIAELSGINFNLVAPEIQASHSGLWYNSDQSGHGLSIEINEGNRIIAIWYTYDNDGNQMWLLGVGTYENNVATLDVTVTDNGVFPPNFVAEDVVSSNWGTFQLDFADCNNANFSWIPNEEFNFTTGELQVSRLTSIKDLSCSEE